MRYFAPRWGVDRTAATRLSHRRRKPFAMPRPAPAFSWTKACFRPLACVVLAGVVSACGTEGVQEYPTDPSKRNLPQGGFFSEEGGITLFDSERQRPGEEGGSGGIGVNAYLWRATLDTISFMPVASADAFGGVIITDWHSTPEAPNERFKMNVYILGRALRADGVKVAVFRQVQDAGGWRDAGLPAETGAKIEDAILTKARQLRAETTE
jgi:hypothetical protein